MAMIAGLIGAACVLGVALATSGGLSSTHLFAAALVALVAVSGVACMILELPVIVALRFGFIASFFFKADINLFKVDELEDPSGLNISLTLILGLALLIYDLVTDEHGDPVVSKTFPYLCGALFCCASISVFYNDLGNLGVFSVIGFLTSVFIAYVIASHFSRRERLRDLVAGVALGLIFTGVVSASQYAIDFPTTYEALGTGTEDELLGTQTQILSRVPAFLRTPTEMAWVISSLVPLVLAPVIFRVSDSTIGQRLFLLLAAFLGVIAIILSLARGSWASLLVGIAITIGLAFFAFKPAERQAYVLSVGIAAVLALLLLAPFGSRIYERLSGDDQGSALIRVPLMETAGMMIEDNPLVGVGPNGYRRSMTKYDETGMFVSQVFPNPVHNVFAHITAEIGVPGGIVFCLLIAAVLFECIRSFSVGDRLVGGLAVAVAAGIIAFVISAMKEPGSLGSGRPPLRTLFFLFGTALALGRMRRRVML